MNRSSFAAELGRSDVVTVREFDAPLSVVFRAFTDPQWYARWFGPRGATTAFERFEPRSGGNWRCIQKLPDGRVLASHGVFHEVEPPDRIVETFEFEDPPNRGHVSLRIVRFARLPDGRTRVITRILAQSVPDRDRLVRFETEQGYSESATRLEELLVEEQIGQRA